MCNSLGLGWKQKAGVFIPKMPVFMRRASNARDKKSRESL
jgi:hypothetical protein